MDAAPLGEFRGVAGIVQQCLPESRFVAPNPRQALVQLDRHCQPLGLRIGRDQGAHLFQQGTELQIDPLQHQAARFDLRQIQNVADDGHQVLGSRVDLGHMVALPAIERAALQQMRQPDDRVHRRADFVAHVRQKCTFRPIRGLCPRARLGQLHRPFLDETFQALAITGQLLLRQLALGDVLLDREIVRDAPIRLPDRGNDRCLDIGGTVLTPIRELAGPDASFGQGPPQRCMRLRRRLSGPQDPGILADDLLARVSGHTQERLVDVLDLRLQIGDHDALGTLLDGLGQFTELLFRGLTLRDVDGDRGVKLGLSRRVRTDPGVHHGRKHRTIQTPVPNLLADEAAFPMQLLQQGLDPRALLVAV